MVLLQVLHPLDDLRVSSQSLPHLVGDRPDEAVAKQHADDHGQDHAVDRHRVELAVSAAAESTCQSLLAGLMLYFTELHDEYPENIEVMEA